MQQVTLNVADEIKALGDLVKKEKEDIEQKKGAPVAISDAVPALLALATSYQKLPEDIKNADNIAYLLKCVAECFLPPPAPAQAAQPPPAA